MEQADRYFKKYHNEKHALFSLASSGPAIITVDLGRLDNPVYSVRVDLIGKVQKNWIMTSMTGKGCNISFDTTESFIGQLSVHAIIRPQSAEVDAKISLDIRHELKNSPIAMYLYGIEGEVARVSPYIADSKAVDPDDFYKKGPYLDMDYRRISFLAAPAPIERMDACNRIYVDTLVTRLDAKVQSKAVAKFAYALSLPNFANKRVNIRLATLFDALGAQSFYKMRLTATLYSINASQVNLTFWRGARGQRYKLLVGEFVGEKAHYSAIDEIVADNNASKDLRIESIVTSSSKWPLPEMLLFVIEIDVFESMGYTGKAEHAGYSSGVTVSNPLIHITNA